MALKDWKKINRFREIPQQSPTDILEPLHWKLVQGISSRTSLAFFWGIVEGSLEDFV